MKKHEFNPKDGYASQASFPNPVNETDTREQIQRLHSQTRDYINDTLIKTLNSSQGAKEIGAEAVEGLIFNSSPATNVDEQIKGLMDIKPTSEGFKKVRVGPEKQLQYSDDGIVWKNASDGILIYDGTGTELPVRKKVVVEKATLVDRGDRIVVIPPQGEKGDPGAPGKDGADGRSFTVGGVYATIEELKQAHPTGAKGDAYSVGNGNNNLIYVWNESTSEWDNAGAISGPAGVGVPTGGKTGQLLVKKSDKDYDFEYIDLDINTNTVLLNITIQPDEWVDRIYTLRHYRITKTSTQEFIPPIYYETAESQKMKQASLKAGYADAGQIDGEAYIKCEGEIPTVPVILRVLIRG